MNCEECGVKISPKLTAEGESLCRSCSLEKRAKKLWEEEEK